MIPADNKTHARLRRIFNPAFSEKNIREQEVCFRPSFRFLVVSESNYSIAGLEAYSQRDD
jgi:hypothetical protein